MAGEGEEDEAAAIELQLEQHLQEQRSSLEAVDEALAADASNAELLEVRTYVRPQFFTSEQFLNPYHGPRLLDLFSGPG
jgi:hypothetical protein